MRVCTFLRRFLVTGVSEALPSLIGFACSAELRPQATGAAGEATTVASPQGHGREGVSSQYSFTVTVGM